MASAAFAIIAATAVAVVATPIATALNPSLNATIRATILTTTKTTRFALRHKQLPLILLRIVVIHSRLLHWRQSRENRAGQGAQKHQIEAQAPAILPRFEPGRG